ncbi:MAG: ABC transporter permease [Sporichthyaceae bacterium]
MNLMWDYMSESDNWRGADGIAARLAEHAGLSALALLGAIAIALPIGAIIGHGRRGDDLPIALGALGRLMPALGVFCYLALKGDGGDSTVLTGLILLAIAPIITAAYTGLRLLDRAAVDSARGSGLSPAAVLLTVELPMAMPALVRGVRTASRQVVAMTAVGAFVGSGGLGRLIIDGQAPEVRDYGQVATGGVLIAAVAIAADIVIVAIGHRLISAGMAGRWAPDRPAPQLPPATFGTPSPAAPSAPMPSGGAVGHAPPPPLSLGGSAPPPRPPR